MKNAKDSSMIDKSVISDIKSDKHSENNEKDNFNKNNLSGMTNIINIIGANENKHMDNSLASKLSNLDDKKEDDNRHADDLKHDYYDKDRNYLKNIDAYTRENFNDEKIKMIQTLTKVFNLNIDNNQIQLKVNNDYLDSEKKIIQLKQKYEETEKSNKEFYKKCREKELEYIEKISNLEKKITQFDKSDLVMLQRQNEDYEVQIANLNKTVQNLTIKQSLDYEKFSNIIEELTSLREHLATELDLTNKLKSALKEFNNNKKAEEKLSNTKVELSIKYNDAQRYKTEEENLDDEKDTKEKKNNGNKIRATTRKKN